MSAGEKRAPVLGYECSIVVIFAVQDGNEVVAHTTKDVARVRDEQRLRATQRAAGPSNDVDKGRLVSPELLAATDDVAAGETLDARVTDPTIDVIMGGK